MAELVTIHHETYGKWVGSGTVLGHYLRPGSTKTLCGKETANRFSGWTRKWSGSALYPHDCQRCQSIAAKFEGKV